MTNPLPHPTFVLLDEPWIPVVYVDGVSARVSLLQIWHELPRIREIWHDSPLVVATIYRLLMAVWYRADPASWASIDTKTARLENGTVPVQTIHEYLLQHRRRFDVFDAEFPFYQTAALQHDEKMKPFPHTILRHSAVSHFDRSDDRDPTPMPVAEAVLYVLEHQAYAFGGRITNSADPAHHAQLLNGLIVLLRGQNLFETLVFSMPVYDNQTLLGVPAGGAPDVPAWEMPPPTQTKRVARGWVDILTWQSRRILLIPTYIDAQWMVKWVIVSGGYALDMPDFRDPMQFQKIIKGNKQLLKIDAQRAVWRDIIPCLLNQVVARGLDFQIQQPQCLHELEELNLFGNRWSPHIQIIGVASDRAKMELWRQETLDVSANVFVDSELSKYVDQALGQCNKGDLCLSTACYALAEAMLARGGQRKIKSEDIRGLMASWGWQVKYWGNLEVHYHSRVLRRLEALIGRDLTEVMDDVVQPIITEWQAFLVRYVRDVFGEIASATHHAHSLRAYSIARGRLEGQLHYHGLIRKEERNDTSDT